MSCGHPFHRCFIKFDILPLVEFTPSNGVAHNDIIEILTSDVQPSSSTKSFDECIHHSLMNQHTLNDETNHAPMMIDRDTIASLSREDVFVIRTPSKTIHRFFKNVLPEVGIALCPCCQHFFHEEDFEFTVLRDEGCPFCKCNVLAKDSVSKYSEVQTLTVFS